MLRVGGEAMAHKTFVSYRYSDQATVGTIKSFFQTHKGPVQGDVVFCRNDVSHLGPYAIDRWILNTVQGCDAALFVIGNNNHNSPWIQREIELADSIPSRS